MNIIGLDLSINSTGICVLKDNEYHFVGYIREGTNFTKKNLEIIEAFKTFKYCSIVTLPKRLTLENYQEQEIEELKDIDHWRFSIIYNLTKILTIKESKIGIEGFSYNSLSQSNSSIYGYGYIFRNFLYNENLKFDILSPGTIKKTAGKGNFSKDKMIESFKENVTLDKDLELTEFWQSLNKEPEKYKNSTGKWFKPFEDIIDAYWIVKTIQKNDF